MSYHGKMHKLPSLRRLDQLLKYSPETGEFFRRFAVYANRLKPTGYKDANGYVNIRIDGTLYKAHRLAVKITTGFDPLGVVDHINENRGDNRISNLQDIPWRMNRARTRKVKSKTSKFRGVGWNKEKGKWRARVCSKHVGYYDCEYAAGGKAALARYAEFGIQGV